MCYGAATHQYVRRKHHQKDQPSVGMDTVLPGLYPQDAGLASINVS